MTYQVRTKEDMGHEDTISMLLRDALFALSTAKPLDAFIKIDSIWISIPDQFKVGKLKDLDPFDKLYEELGSENFQKVMDSIKDSLLPFEVDEAQNEVFSYEIRKLNRKLIMAYETALFDAGLLMRTRRSFITGMKENIGDIKQE